jgi:hypothetical protein
MFFISSFSKEEPDELARIISNIFKEAIENIEKES